MAYWDIARATTGARLLTDVGVEHGLTVDQCLAGTGLTQDALSDQDVHVATWQELVVARNLIYHLSEIPYLGFSAGLRHRATTYGIAGLLLLSSSTLRSAAMVLFRFGPLTHVFSRTEIVKDADTTAVVFDTSRLPADIGCFLAEREVAATAIAVRDALGDRPADCRVEFRHNAPRMPYRYRKAAGIRAVFGAAENRLVLANSEWDRPLPQADPPTCREAEKHCRDLVVRRLASRTVSGQVLDQLRTSAYRLPGLDNVAATMMTTPRTLRRRLSAEGTSFRALVEQVHLHRATQLLSSDGTSVEQVAAQLGYTDPTAFTHAFKRWTGTSPRAYRTSFSSTAARDGSRSSRSYRARRTD